MTVCTVEPSDYASLYQAPVPPFAYALAPNPELKVCVIIPARNEAENLPHTLSALYQQIDDQGATIDKSAYEILLLINNSSDASQEIARRYQLQHPDLALHIACISLPKPKANIGTVRRLLMDVACQRLKQATRTGIIASTDGDTVVDKRWIYHIMQEIGKGADAVGGRILTHSNTSPVRRWHLRDVMYRTLLAQAEGLIDPCQYDPWPRHHQYFGANLAVTCTAYEQAGCLPEVPFLEDYALCEALKNIDARIRRSNAVKVYTSDRQQGRVEVGFSEQLNTWSKFITKQKVQVTEPVEPQIIKWRCKIQLRQLHLRLQKNELLSLAHLTAVCHPLQLPHSWLFRQMKNSLYFGKLWQTVEKRLISNKWNEQWLPQPITDAIAELRLFIAGHR